MLLITKPTTVFSSGSSFHQFHTQNHHCFLNKNVKFHPEPSSITSQLVSPTISTKSASKIPSNHQITHHNANITRFCEMGNLQKAMNLIFTSEEYNLDTKTYCDVLQLCADLKALNFGKQIYNIICLKGTEIDHVLGAKLVFMFVNCGDLKEGRRIFNNISDNIPKINVFLWNFMMNAYAKKDDYKESVYLFTKMIETGFEPDGYTFTSIFKCLARIEDDNLSEMIHGYVVKSGFGFDINVVNSMISLYFKRGSVNNAHKLFVDMPDRDVITWNTMISGYVANRLAKKGFEVFVKMLCTGVSVDLATMVSVVIACANIGVVNLGREIHGYAVKTTFNKKMKFSSTLLDMYSKCGDTNAAMKVFNNMDEKSVVSWTSMISGFVREGESNKAINLFLEMKNQDVKPDTFTVTSILHACALNGSLENGKDVHNYIKENQMQTLVVSNALMDMYAKCGSMDDSYSVFSQMNFKDTVSWNTMIGGYSKNCLPSNALDLFKSMQHEINPDNITMTCILPACASLASLNKGREIHGYILRKGLTLDQYVVNSLIDMYVKCGGLGLAKSLFDMTILKNLVTWTIMIAGYCMHGFGHEGVSMFKKMCEKGIEPNEASLTSILYACSHSGLFEEGWKFYNLMVKDYKIEPELEHYGCMVELFSRAGKLSEAYKFICSMPVKPNATIWGSLLYGCRFHHDVKLAEQVAEKLFELEPENTDYYLLLANIYSETEKWEEIKVLKGRIRTKTGCSWIEIKGKVYVFVAGDKQNPDAKKIESLIDNLKIEMKNSRKLYLKYSLGDKETMKKEGVVCGHSESLAMGFGILKLPAGRTIRVTKNVRVCGECHELAKFISTNVGRQIVLRDSNRFHHFKDGVCSCRGYW